MTATGDLDARMTEFLTNVGDAMGLQLTVTAEALDDATRVSIEGDECDVFLQNKAEGLDALQHLVMLHFAAIIQAVALLSTVLIIVGVRTVS